MTGQHRTPVTVVGLGSMGSALAEAFIDAGHPTTVWNTDPVEGHAARVQRCRSRAHDG